MFQNTTSHAITRVMSTARCWASGDSEITSSNESSSSSSNAFRPVAGDIDADLVHHLHRKRIESPGRTPTEFDEDAVAEQVLQDPLGHRRAHGVLRAREQYGGRAAATAAATLSAAAADGSRGSPRPRGSIGDARMPSGTLLLVSGGCAARRSA